MKKIETHRLSKYLHGTFAEYFGSTVYDGIWVGKDSDIPNVNGIRRDVIEGIRECGLSVFAGRAAAVRRNIIGWTAHGKMRHPLNVCEGSSSFFRLELPSLLFPGGAAKKRF